MSNRVDYACRALMVIAGRHSDAHPVTVPEIAAATGLSAPYLVHVLSQLRSSRLVSARRGAGGGHLLARDPSDISLSDIVTAVQGTIDVAPAELGAAGAPAQLLLAAMWEELSLALRQLLTTVTLADLVRLSAPAQEPERPTGALAAAAWDAVVGRLVQDVA